MVKEIWKGVSELPDYEISSLGRLRNKVTGTIRKWSVDEKGYLFLTFRVNGRWKIFKAHRMVAEAFIPNPNNLPEIHHKDSNRGNPCADNLEWISRKDNVEHQFADGTHIMPKRAVQQISLESG